METKRRIPSKWLCKILWVACELIWFKKKSPIPFWKISQVFNLPKIEKVSQSISFRLNYLIGSMMTPLCHDPWNPCHPYEMRHHYWNKDLSMSFRCHVKYVSVIWLVFHVLQLLPINPHNEPWVALENLRRNICKDGIEKQTPSRDEVITLIRSERLLMS